MPYNANIPQPTDQLSTSQVDLLNNFQAIFTLIGVNHNNFGSAPQPPGSHNFLELPVPTVPPVTVGGEVGMYSEVSPYTMEPELVFAKQALTTAPLATYEVSSGGYTATGWSRLGSGILLKWGTATMAVPGINSFTFPIAATIPAFGVQNYCMLICPNSNVVVYLNGYSDVGFSVNTNAPGAITFLAIGI